MQLSCHIQTNEYLLKFDLRLTCIYTIVALLPVYTCTRLTRSAVSLHLASTPVDPPVAWWLRRHYTVVSSVAN